jgi:RNA polymerase sigma-70 factor (ECF subfamily)
MTVDALRQGRPEVLADLLDRYGREIGGVAYLILRDRAAAEDVVTETLLTALERGSGLRDPDALRPWLLRIAANHALGMRRREARVVRLHIVPESRTSGGLASADDRAAVLEGIAALPPRMRAAVVLRYYADLSVEGVAEALDVSPNTVKTQLQTAFDRLRSSLAEELPRAPEMRHA